MIIACITLFMATGIFTGYYLNLSPITTALFLSLSTVLFVFAYHKSKKQLIQKPHFTISTGLLAFTLGLFSITTHKATYHKNHYSHYLNNNTVIEGTISQRLKPNEFSEKYFLEVCYVNKNQSSGKILISTPKTKPLEVGDKIIITEKPKTIKKSLNPYQFDYAEYMAKQNVFHEVRLNKNCINAGKNKTLDYYIQNLRNTLIKSFDSSHYDKATLNFLNALLLGQRQDLDPVLTETYASAGVMHILAISGLHIAILFYIISFLLKPLHYFHKKGRLLRLILLLSSLWIFAIISGLSPSVVRAVIMFSFISIGQYINRDTHPINSIAVSMLLILVVSPNQLFDVGFQLSYTAVIAIVLFKPLYKNFKPSRYRVINYLLEITLISAIAQVSLLPFCLYYFKQFPGLFILSNAVVIPLTGIILITALLTLALNFTFTQASFITGHILEWLIKAMNTYTSWIASFSSFNFKNIAFTISLSILLGGALICIGCWLFKQTYKRTIAVLTSLLIFQACYLAHRTAINNKEELIVFNSYKEPLIAIKKAKQLIILSNDTLTSSLRAITDYKTANFTPNDTIIPLKNFLSLKEHKILVIDKSNLYPENINPDIIVLTQSPKINLDKILTQLNPKQVVADATNYPYLTELWKATCIKRKIPFHAVAEKGYYIVE
ncbi:ComEC family competence protein [Flavobacterium alkalisoli]|uniref:ComEC family competence protein n=1 Tax=Flavobacterium alkalisoli TaxID=2602769 RepID=A0A5B9FSV8_9FLAO|nr:ComEC/Rec2 family competence protein [Flavobacterium alkalisoli]QEE49236.1 ComEC family competence protein [Flavobacterium alkalisoli]